MVVSVDGPCITNESRSSLSWHMLPDVRQTVAAYDPAVSVPRDSK